VQRLVESKLKRKKTHYILLAVISQLKTVTEINDFVGILLFIHHLSIMQARKNVKRFTQSITQPKRKEYIF